METETTSFLELLAKTFRADDFVRIVNIDDEPLEWEYCVDEDVVQPDKMTRRVENRKVNTYRLDAGQTTKIQGAIAYVGLKVLYDRLVAKNEEKFQSRNNPEVREKWLKEMYLGKDNDSLQSVEVEAEKAPELNEVVDLGNKPTQEEEFAGLKEQSNDKPTKAKK